MLTRNDGRAPEMGRPVTIETDFVRTADGSCLICTGNTKVIWHRIGGGECAAVPARKGGRAG